MKRRAGTLLVYMKYPEPGHVKTRLAATIGPERAAQLYWAWIGQVLDRLQPIRGSIPIIGAIDVAAPDAFAEWEQLVDQWWPQPAGDLGRRLDAGFAFASGAGGPVAAIGTDCLEIEPETIRSAFRMLREQDAVFGPTFDGGYYLVGTARYLSAFFEGIRWSSEHTLADHRFQCARNNWTIGLLPRATDIDTWDDWVAYCARIGTSPQAF